MKILFANWLCSYDSSFKKANTESYFIDNTKIDNLFALSQDVTSNTLMEANALSASTSDFSRKFSNKRWLFGQSFFLWWHCVT